ncbi:MAG: YbjN domain-containing protein [Alphaproteobacteria bacterium]|nr:YbjN domain-containing protein [Alphaproteobacteria bacterium]
MRLETHTSESQTNPLDNVEDVLDSNNWVFSRLSDEELMVSVSGKHCDYRLFFIWQKDLEALQFCCQYDMNISDINMVSAAKVLMHINEGLWMGHFDIPQDTKCPSFRHTCLMRGLNLSDIHDHIEDLVDISLAQCERSYSMFHFLCESKVANDQIMSLALMETSGEA